MEKYDFEMGKILKDELIIFEKLFVLEEHKTSAILEHDGKLLERISRDQEVLLSNMQPLESERLKKMAACKKARHIKKDKATLKDIAEAMGGANGANLATVGGKLAGLITRLNHLLEANRMLINDNMEYYNILLTGLRNNRTVDAGYSPDGKEEDIPKQSVLFNQTA